MSLPIRTTLDDIRELCRYYATKPSGATVQDARTVLDSKKLDCRKITALKYWGLLEEQEDCRLKLTPAGHNLTKSGDGERDVLLEIIRNIPAYDGIIERVAHRNEHSLDTTDLGAHWQDHFKSDVADSDRILNDQAVCFFHIAEGASLGKLITGRKGNATRFIFLADALKSYISHKDPRETTKHVDAAEGLIDAPSAEDEPKNGNVHPQNSSDTEVPGQGIFIAHGKNKKPLDQLKKILDQFHIPYKVAAEEHNHDRPICGKDREIMHSCNCAILIFTADEQFQDKDGNTVWIPSENVVYELGASGYLYENRIVILKEDKVTFPSNFSDLGYISFESDMFEAKALDILKELVGFGIVRIST